MTPERRGIVEGSEYYDKPQSGREWNAVRLELEMADGDAARAEILRKWNLTIEDLPDDFVK